MRISILTFIAFCFLCHFSFGQGLSKAEYFFDNDPGFGNGVSINLSGNPDSINQNFSIPIGSLSQGFHNLFFRVKNTQGKWAMYMGRRFFVLPSPSNTINGPISKAEYFFDSDPGFGNGTPINISPTSDSLSQNIAVPISGLTVGFHNLFFRVKSNQGKWSMYMGRRFYVLPNLVAPSSKKIINAEYFFDTDPGVGNGVDLPIGQIGDSVSFSSVLNVGNLSLGSHVISVRVQDSSRVWSLYFSSPFNVCANPPTSSITYNGSLNLCTGQSINLNGSTGSGYTYQWYQNGSPLANETNANYNANSSGSYTLNVTNSSGCSSMSNAVTVNIYPYPSVAVTASGPLSICSGDSVTLQASSASGNIYQWLLGNSIIPGETSSMITIDSAGSYRVEINNAGGCRDTSSYYIVSVNTSPVISIDTLGSTNLCIGSEVSFQINGTGNLFYQWYLNASPISGATLSSLVASSPGQYYAEVTNALGCTLTTGEILVNQSSNVAPSPNILVNDSILCIGDSALLSTNLSGNLSYEWYLNGNQITGSTSSNLFTNQQGNYFVVVTDLTSGCSGNSGLQNINILASVIPTITGNPSLNICLGSNIRLITGNIYSNYQWWLNGAPVGTSNDTLTVNLPGAYMVNVVDANGCNLNSDTAFVSNAIAPAAPIISPSGYVEICMGTNLTLATATGYSSYKWYRNGVQAGLLNTVSVSQIVGLQNYYVVITNSDGCSAVSDTTTIKVNALPTINLSQIPTNIGLGWTPPLVGNPPGGIFTGLGVQGNASSGYYFDPISVGVGSFQINYAYTDSVTGCSNSMNISINVNPTGLAENTEKNYSLFPNPSNHFFEISGISKVQSLWIYDSSGKQIDVNFSHQNDSIIRCDASNLAPGLYLLLINTNNGIYTEKVQIIR
jgi:hypothetical protein